MTQLHHRNVIQFKAFFCLERIQTLLKEDLGETFLSNDKLVNQVSFNPTIKEPDCNCVFTACTSLL